MVRSLVPLPVLTVSSAIQVFLLLITSCSDSIQAGSSCSTSHIYACLCPSTCCFVLFTVWQKLSFTFSCMPFLSLYHTRFGTLLMAASKYWLSCQWSFSFLYACCHLRKRKLNSSSSIGSTQISSTLSKLSDRSAIWSLSARRTRLASFLLAETRDCNVFLASMPVRYANIASASEAGEVAGLPLS